MCIRDRFRGGEPGTKALRPSHSGGRSLTRSDFHNCQPSSPERTQESAEVYLSWFLVLGLRRDQCVAARLRLLVFHSAPACDTVPLVDMNFWKLQFDSIT